jgi:putative lipoprotein
MLEGQARYRPSTRCLHDLAELASLTLSNERAGRRPYDGVMGDDAEPATLSVTVFYRERIAMPPNAALIVTLADVSRADAPAETVESRRIEEPGNVPVDVELTYDRSIIDDGLTYAVRATIEVDGEMWWTSTQAHQVLTHGAPDHVEVMVSRVSG